MHDRTLSVIEEAPAALVIRLNQTPEIAELRRLPRFQDDRRGQRVCVGPDRDHDERIPPFGILGVVQRLQPMRSSVSSKAQMPSCTTLN